jgi:hypothetical protein
MKNPVRVALTVIGAVLLGAAITGTIDSYRDGGAGNGPLAGGIIAGLGLALLLIPWLRD